jgi:hypothetical protein
VGLTRREGADEPHVRSWRLKAVETSLDANAPGYSTWSITRCGCVPGSRGCGSWNLQPVSQRRRDRPNRFREGSALIGDRSQEGANNSLSPPRSPGAERCPTMAQRHFRDDLEPAFPPSVESP